MTLKNALSHFNRLVSETNKKSEIRVYQNFIHILTSLQKRNLTETEIQSMEMELDALDLNTTPVDKKRYFSKALKQFKKYLKDTFSLTTRGYYTDMGMVLGASFGINFGIVVMFNFERSLGISFGITLGILVGLIIGRYLDSQAMAAGKMV